MISKLTINNTAMKYSEYLEKKKRFTEEIKSQTKPEIKIPTLEEYLQYRKKCEEFEGFCTLRSTENDENSFPLVNLTPLVDLTAYLTENDYELFEANLRKIMIDMEYVNRDEGIETSTLEYVANIRGITKDNLRARIQDLFDDCMSSGYPKTCSSTGGVEVYTDILDHQVKITFWSYPSLSADDAGDETY